MVRELELEWYTESVLVGFNVDEDENMDVDVESLDEEEEKEEEGGGGGGRGVMYCVMRLSSCIARTVSESSG